MNVKRLIIAAIVIWIVSAVWGFLTCGWLFNWVYQIAPMIWRSNEAIMSGTTLGLSLVFGLLIAFIFVIVYGVLYDGIPSEGVKKGLVYGFLLWLVCALSGMITMPLYMTISWTVVIYWIINALVMMLINGAIVGAIYED
jgi:MFS family permease